MANNQAQATAVEKNPFAIIGATVRDDRHKIVALAEEKSLAVDPTLCTKARSDLTNPKNRLSAEVAWMPGVSPKRAIELMALVKDDPKIIRERGSNVPSLALANLMGAAFEVLDEKLSVADWVNWMIDLADTIERIDPNDVLRDVNEDRTVSGFPAVKGIEPIESELVERRRYYKETLQNALDRLPSQKLLEVVTQAVETATSLGQKHAPALIDDVVDSYALGIQTFLRQGADNIIKLINHIKTLVPQGVTVILPQLEKLGDLVSKWNKFAQPIQVGMKSRGIEHDVSRHVAYNIRDLGIFLANEHGMIDAAAVTTKLLQKCFSELPELADRVGEDAKTLDEMFATRNDSSQKNEEFAKEITYEFETGLIFKDKFSISPAGISWKSKTYPLDTITRVRYGGVHTTTRLYGVVPIASNTSYTIGFGDNIKSSVMKMTDQKRYQAVTDKIWKAMCIRLMTNMLEALKAGKKINFADAVVDDSGIEVTKRKFLKSERIHLKWSEMHVWSASGYFVIGSQTDKQCYAQLSYIETENTHILEACLRFAFKKGVGKQLSGILN